METNTEGKVKVVKVPFINSWDIEDIENRPKAKTVYVDKSELVEIKNLKLDDGTASRVGE